MKILTLFTITALSIYSTAKAQKLEKPSIDKMTGDTTFKTTAERIYTSISWSGGETDILYSYAAKVKGDKFLILHINITNGKHSSVFAINKGSKTYLKLFDGSIIEMQPGTNEISEGQVFPGGLGLNPNTRGDAYPIFELSPNLIDKLKSSEIKMIRIETSNGNMDFELKDKNSKVIAKEIELIESVH
ncbi:hypothetical protein [Mucilaginibacter polytrichastri]|nr:hypothetical protein [Mucilaginibacter polytrichastri]